MKRIGIIFLFLLGTFNIWAASPELKNMLPLNYAKLNRLSDSQTEELVQDCAALLENSKRTFNLGTDFSYYTTYTQRIGDRLFYRVFVTSSELGLTGQWKVEDCQLSESEYYWLSSPVTSILQVILEKKGNDYSYIASDVFGQWQNLGLNGLNVYYSDFLLFSANDDVAIVHGTFSLPVAIGMMKDGLTRITPKTRNGHYYAKQNAQYTLINANGGSNVFASDKFILTISASDFLVDSNAPLRYSILSAFDGDPNTCYKENAEENFITLAFSFKTDTAWTKRNGKLRIKEALIINGDASSRNAYFGTNRIAALTAEASENINSNKKETYTFTLNDYQFASQSIFLPFTEGKNYYVINTTKIYKADADDACMSEFNLKTQNIGWLFAGK